MKEDIYAKTENRYIITRSKIRDLLKNGEESANSKICCHVEYGDTDMPKITLPKFNGNQAD
jgi:hypothetical protein